MGQPVFYTGLPLLNARYYRIICVTETPSMVASGRCRCTIKKKITL